jgi:hypothetical protein
VSAQKSLRIKFYGNKTIKALKTKANPEEVVG